MLYFCNIFAYIKYSETTVCDSTLLTSTIKLPEIPSRIRISGSSFCVFTPFLRQNYLSIA